MTYRGFHAPYVWLAGLAVLMFAVQPASGASLRLTSGADTMTVSDGDANDLHPETGVVTFLGSVGNFNVNVSTGITKPIIGRPDFGEMDLNSIDVSQGSGTLVIEFTDTDFTNVNIPAWIMEIGGVTDGEITYSAYIGNNNLPFEQGTLIGDMGPYGNGAFADTLTSGVSPSSEPYSLTQVVTIRHPSGTNVTSFNVTLRAIPEPGTASLALLGLGITGFATLRRRRKNQAT